MKRFIWEKREKRLITDIFGLDTAHKNSAIRNKHNHSKAKKFVSTVV